MKHLLKNKIEHLSQIIGTEIVERNVVIKLLLLGVFSKESTFLLGPPGIGKSLLSRKVSSVFKNSKDFEVLMNKFTMPDEIFGPIDIIKLKEGHFQRKIEHYLPDANIAFLDEIWKASSSIQNTLLTIINEKIFVNDGVPQYVNIYSVISASNELPERKAGLEALWDRFLIKFNLGNIENDNNFIKMISNQGNILKSSLITEEDKLDFKIVDEISNELPSIKIPQLIKDFILALRQEVEVQNSLVLKQNPFADGFDQFYVSDRKWKKIIGILQASAYLNERDSIELSDTNILFYMLWNNVSQFSFYKESLKKHIYNFKYDGIFKKRVNDLMTLRQNLINLTTVVLNKEQIVIKDVIKNGKIYYRFIDENKNIYYFVKEEMVSISTKANFSIDWLISYITEDEFENNITTTKKMLVKYEKSHFYIYENNDENRPTVQIYTEFEKKVIYEYELKKISNADLKKWNEMMQIFKNNINSDIKTINDGLLNQINSGNVNIFWDDEIKNDEIVLGKKIEAILLDLINKVEEMNVEKETLKFGFSLSNLDILYNIKLDPKEKDKLF